MGAGSRSVVQMSQFSDEFGLVVISSCTLTKLLNVKPGYITSVRENVCSNSKNVKSHVFLDFEKRLKRTCVVSKTI